MPFTILSDYRHFPKSKHCLATVQSSPSCSAENPTQLFIIVHPLQVEALPLLSHIPPFVPIPQIILFLTPDSSFLSLLAAHFYPHTVFPQTVKLLP